VAGNICQALGGGGGGGGGDGCGGGEWFYRVDWNNTMPSPSRAARACRLCAGVDRVT